MKIDDIRDEYGPFVKPAPDWSEYLMGFARHAATKSKDTTKVGAALVGPNREVRLCAYNGPPIGVKDLPERFERPAKYSFALHAESGLIATAAKFGIMTDNCTLYTTHTPCASCMRSIIQAGITCVVIDDGVTVMPIEPEAEIMASEAGVEIRRM